MGPEHGLISSPLEPKPCRRWSARPTLRVSDRPARDQDRALAQPRRKFERDKSELRDLGVVLETHKVSAEHTDQEVEGYVLKAKDFYLPYLGVAETAGSERSDRNEPKGRTMAFSVKLLGTSSDGLPWELYARVTFATVSQVRVVTSLPNVFSSSAMKTGPFGLGI